MACRRIECWVIGLGRGRGIARRPCIRCAAVLRVDGPGDGPTIVMLPGPTDSWLSYEPTLDRLSGSIRGVAV